MIEVIAARGNSSLESAVSLTKSIRRDIQSLGARVTRAVAYEESAQRSSSRIKSSTQSEAEMKAVIKDMRALLDRIEDAVPLINLAITTSGAKLSTSLPASISPSRLMQASTFLSAADSQYSMNHELPTQVGPAFTLSMWMLFVGHANCENGLERPPPKWKEVIHKANVKLIRVPLQRVKKFPFSYGALEHDQRERESGLPFHSVPAEAPSQEYAYQLTIIEDLEDDRVHTFEEEDTKPTSLDGVEVAGMRHMVPIHEVSKLFYADTGKILRIGSDEDTNSPVLLLKCDPNAALPREMMKDQGLDSAAECANTSSQNSQTLDSSRGKADDEDSEIEAQFARESSTCAETVRTDISNKDFELPSSVDTEWIGFAVYSEAACSDTESDVDQNDVPLSSFQSGRSRQESLDPDFVSDLSKLNLDSETLTPTSTTQKQNQLQATTQEQALLRIENGPVKTSLSLLEMLIRLTSLQQFQQCSHLAITDELLNFFLQESSTTGAGDVEARMAERLTAILRLGFDPYQESPVRRHGEDYQFRGAEPNGHPHGGEWDNSRRGSSSPTHGSAEDPLSPLLLRSRRHLSRSRTGTPELRDLR